MVELLKQPQFVPMDVIDQIVSIFAGTKGFLDDVKKSEVPRFERELIEYMQSTGKSVRDQLVAKRAFNDELTEKLTAALRDFKANWK